MRVTYQRKRAAKNEEKQFEVSPSWRLILLSDQTVAKSRQLSPVVTIYNIRLRMTFPVLVAFFAGVTSVMTTILISVAYFGDKNPRWEATGNHRVPCRRDF